MNNTIKKLFITRSDLSVLCVCVCVCGATVVVGHVWVCEPFSHNESYFSDFESKRKFHCIAWLKTIQTQAPTHTHTAQCLDTWIVALQSTHSLSLCGIDLLLFWTFELFQMYLILLEGFPFQCKRYTSVWVSVPAPRTLDITWSVIYDKKVKGTIAFASESKHPNKEYGSSAFISNRMQDDL